MHECNLARAVDVRVSIFIRLSTVGGPTGMSNADGMSNRAIAVRTDQFNAVCLVSVGSKFGENLVNKGGDGGVMVSVDLYLCESQSHACVDIPWDLLSLAWWQVQHCRSRDS